MDGTWWANPYSARRAATAPYKRFLPTFGGVRRPTQGIHIALQKSHHQKVPSPFSLNQHQPNSFDRKEGVKTIKKLVLEQLLNFHFLLYFVYPPHPNCPNVPTSKPRKSWLVFLKGTTELGRGCPKRQEPKFSNRCMSVWMSSLGVGAELALELASSPA